MRITHLGHAAVLVETGGYSLLIDPGNIDPAWHELTGLNAVLLTHLHPDHLDPEHLPALLAANPGAQIVGEPSIFEAAAGTATGGATGGGATVPELPGAVASAPGETTAVGEVQVTAVGGRHAVVHPDLPQIGNVGFVISAPGEPTLFHPGDSYAATPDGVDVLAVPLWGPWAKVGETVDFVRAVDPSHAFAIHDGHLADRGRALVIGRIGAMASVAVHDLNGQGPVSFPLERQA